MLTSVEGSRSQGEFDKAIQVANELISIEPSDHRAYRARALLLFEMKKYIEAFKDLDFVVELCANSPAPYFERAACNLELGKDELVIEDIDVVIKFQDAFFLKSAYAYRAIASMNLGNLQDAKAACSKLPVGYKTWVATQANGGEIITRESLLRSIEKRSEP